MFYRSFRVVPFIVIEQRYAPRLTAEAAKAKVSKTHNKVKIIMKANNIDWNQVMSLTESVIWLTLYLLTN